MTPVATAIAPRLLAWFDQHGRHDLPWQHPRTPYRVWIAEIMLQQTQVATVLPYYQRFLARFPELPALAAAELDAVLAHWAGLGYYSRARNLHRAARICVEQHGGELPADFDPLLALPGIGRSTAAAILAQALGQRHAILDGNVKRVLCRYHEIDGWPGERVVQNRLWQLAEAHTPEQRVADYTQAIMDLGATLCARKPDCPRCPLAEHCMARASGKAAQLPASRPRKARPERRCSLLWLVDGDGRTLLQRRPPVGIWGGLWSLPELDWLDPEDTEQADSQINQWGAGLGLACGPAEALAPVQHDFTHFRLQLQPWRAGMATNPRAAVAEVEWYRWITADGLARVGLPAPIARLLGGG